MNAPPMGAIFQGDGVTFIARKLDLRGGGFSAVKVTRGDGGWEVIVETTGGTDRFAIAPDYKVTRR